MFCLVARPGDVLCLAVPSIAFTDVSETHTRALCALPVPGARRSLVSKLRALGLRFLHMFVSRYSCMSAFFGRLSLRRIFQTGANGFSELARQCRPVCTRADLRRGSCMNIRFCFARFMAVLVDSFLSEECWRARNSRLALLYGPYNQTAFMLTVLLSSGFLWSPGHAPRSARSSSTPSDFSQTKSTPVATNLPPASLSLPVSSQFRSGKHSSSLASPSHLASCLGSSQNTDAAMPSSLLDDKARMLSLPGLPSALSAAAAASGTEGGAPKPFVSAFSSSLLGAREKEITSRASSLLGDSRSDRRSASAARERVQELRRQLREQGILS